MKGGESEGDLSTLFVIVKSILTDLLKVRAAEIMQNIGADVQDIRNVILRFEKLSEFGDLMVSDVFEGMLKILTELADILVQLLLLLGEQVAANANIDRLRYINIETPNEVLKKGSVKGLTGAERVENYEFIVKALKAVGLHCCGTDAIKAEEKIKTGLRG